MREQAVVEELLRQASGQEKEYNWLASVESYKRALKHILEREDFSNAGCIQEKIGYSFYRAAFQAEKLEDFASRMKSAIAAYEAAAGLFDKAKELENLAKSSHCLAMAAYVNSWITSDASERKKLLDECWKLERNVMETYKESGDEKNLATIYNCVMMCLVDRFNLEWDAPSREKIIDEVIGYGEKAIDIFSKLENKQQLALAYNLAGLFHKHGAFARGFETRRREESRDKALSYQEKAIEISEKICDAYLTGRANVCLANAQCDILGVGGPQQNRYFELALRKGILVRDNLLIGSALRGISFCTFWSAATQEDPDKSEEECEKAEKYCEEAVRHYELASYDFGLAECYCLVSARAREQRIQKETNKEKKRLLIEEFVKRSYKSLEHLRKSGSITLVFHVMKAINWALRCLANVETNVNEKRRLLQESSKYMEEGIAALKQVSAVADVEPREFNLGVGLFFLAKNQVELADIEEKNDEKIKLLKDAIVHMREGIEFQLKWTKSLWACVEQGHYFWMGEFSDFLGKTLNQLYSLTNDTTFLDEAVRSFQETIGMYSKSDALSRVAEAHWQLAEILDNLKNHLESAENFKLASKNYVLVSEKIPLLKEFYSDYARYMQAWSKIEEAKCCHLKQEFGQAKRYYEKAANLHKDSESWSYLTSNYLAWAQLEHGEDLSRDEQSQEAIQAFRKASELFHEAESVIRVELGRIENADEKSLAKRLIKASDSREKYCLGRIALEEAKILYRHGDFIASSRKYDSAIEKFEEIIDAIEYESDRQELRPMMYLCRALQMMAKAEVESSPELYQKASQLFDEAKKHSPGEKAKILMLGHDLFCRALEAGTRFEHARDMTSYSTAIKHLESAAQYYEKAGFQSASEYAKATQRLFDAYVFMDKAKEEVDPDKRAKYYTMAEKVLEASAGSYLKAKYPEKRGDALRLLKNVREERELAVSLSEVLQMPSTATTTATLLAPTPTKEKAVGIERFEHANIQANLAVRSKEVKIGEDFAVSIKLINAGNAPALLVKIEDLITDGFDAVKEPEIYSIEGHFLDMKGKRLDPLKTESIKVILKPALKGSFFLKPKIIYLDDTGNSKSLELEPITITVKELGISGWIKGGS